jgi:hypothetical protein
MKMKGIISMRLLITTLLAAVCVATATLTPASLRAASAAGSAHPACTVRLIGQQACYYPAQATQAERRVPWAVPPHSAMRLTFGLKLSQISVAKFPGAKGGMQIDYLYGPLVKDYGRQGAFPIAIRISESNSRVNVERFKPRWTRDVCGMKVEISPAADPQRPHPKYGPWYVVGKFPQGNRSFAIVGNTGQTQLETLACRLAGNIGR